MQNCAKEGFVNKILFNKTNILQFDSYICCIIEQTVEPNRSLLADKLTTGGHLVEVLLLAIGHVLLHQTSSVRDLPLLRQIRLLDSRAQLVLISLDQSADVGDVELLRVSPAAEVSGKSDSVAAALRAASMQSEFSNAVRLLNLKRDHDSGDDLVGGF